MKKNYNRRKRYIQILIIILLIIIFTSIIIAVNKLQPETEATSASETGETIVVSYSAGEFSDAFTTAYSTLTSNATSGYVTFPSSFASTVAMNEESYTKKVDDETFYFNDEEYSYTFVGWKAVGATTSTPTETVFQPGDYIDIETLKEYEVEGIVQFEALWAKVIYAQNPYETMYYTDYWIYDKETTAANYAATGAWNYSYDEETDILTLNKGYDVDNPVSTLDYAYYLIYQLEYANSYANNTAKNAYAYVIMLTGDLDYCKSSSNGTSQENFIMGYDIYDGETYDSDANYIFGEYVAQQQYWGYFGWYMGDIGTIATADRYGTLTAGNTRAASYCQSVTFKSMGDETYSLKINGFGYYDYAYSSIRIDNVKFAQTSTSQKPCASTPVNIGTETYFQGTEGNYIEFTVRSSSDKFTFRTGKVQTVVLNGGTMNSWETSYSSAQTVTDYELHWYLGGSGYITNYVTLGVTSSYETNISNVSGDFVFTMTGGYTNIIRGASAGLNSTSSGTRTINIIGDGTTNSTTSPKVNNVYGGAYQGTFTGNTYVNVKGTVNVKNVYGGGCDFTATTYGNTNVNIDNCTISGNVFAGGYNGNVEIDDDGNGGNATLNISNSTISGSVYGSGMGGTQTLTTQISYSAAQKDTNWQDEYYIPDDSVWTKNEVNGDYSTDWSWEYPASGFPYVQDETNYVCIAIYKAITWTSNAVDNLTYQRYYIYAYLSLATVANDVNISIDGSTIGGSVYGGGSVAVVGGNTNISITGNSTITGSVYGGGDGATQPNSVTVYYPDDSEDYSAPSYSVTKTTSGSITNVTFGTESSTYKSYKYSSTFTWSSESSLLDTNGIDEDSYLIYSPNVEGLGLVKGNTSVTVENSTVTGNIVAGGNAADVYGDTTLIVTNSSANNIYGGGYSGDVSGNSYTTINTVSTTDVYGGGYSGNVVGTSTMNITDIAVTNIYGGGYSGYVGSTVITVNSGTAEEIFGGGYSGYVGGDTSITILKGEFTNIFGGSDQSYVAGNTNIVIGDSSDLNNLEKSITVEGVVYGGGRGEGYSTSGDASDVKTVYKNSTVTIQGIYTDVQNYGSVKFGAVVGEANIYFNEYWSGNPTAKYKTMNGIDRATTVTFSNSYVLLTNQDESGNTVGIESIENLVIPSGSGLKISASGEISGNFEGGGELYLDSLVCLTVGGNISGETTLVLNPTIVASGENQIAGGIEQPYLIVKGSTNDDVTDGSAAIRLVSGETRYTILCTTDNTSNYSYYYIEKTITITDDINVTSTSIEDRVYIGEISNEDVVYILNSGAFSSDIVVDYSLTETTIADNFKNITRTFSLNTDKTTFVTLPVGTEICMIVDNTYYFYTVTSATSEIALSEFKDANGSNYTELTDFTDSSNGVKITTNETTGYNSYTYNEEFRFIVNFSNAESFIEAGTYYPIINIFDNDVWFEDNQTNNATDILQIQNREYEYDYSLDKLGYLADDEINITGTLDVSSVASSTYLSSNELELNLKLYNNGTEISLPVGTIITINDTSYSVTTDELEISLISSLGTDEYNESLNISLDFSNVMSYDLLSSGTYNLTLEYVSDGITVANNTVSITISNYDLASYGLTAEISQDNNIAYDRIQLITQGEQTARTVLVNYTGNIEGAYIEISALKQDGTEFIETTESSGITLEAYTSSITSGTETSISIIFDETVEAGTYRILIKLCDQYGNELTEDYVNFIVL